MRSIHLESALALDEPAVHAQIDAAGEQMAMLIFEGHHRTLPNAITKVQRPRRGSDGRGEESDEDSRFPSHSNCCHHGHSPTGTGNTAVALQ